MTSAVVLTSILVVTLVAQALRPNARLLIVLAGAGASAVASAAFGLGGSRELLADVPWDVLVLLVALGLLSEMFVHARLFAVLAVRAAEASRASRVGLVLVFGTAMYLTSGLMNNLTALVLVLPVVLVVFRVVGVSRKQAAWTLGALIVACNLGGAATPIGDFPAILLLGRGAMSFGDYLVRAAPATVVALVLFLAIATGVVRRTAAPSGPIGRSISRALIRALYRGVRIDRRLFAPLATVFLLMLVAWVSLPTGGGWGADLVAWLGVLVALWLRPRLGERLVRSRIDIEAVLFLLALFVMVVAVRRTGVFGDAARVLTALPLPPAAQLVVFLLLAGLVTGVFSAGPAMAALLEVAAVLATKLPGHVVYVGLALAVCAGSSLFLTAATAGPLAQSLTERAALQTTEGARLRFGFSEFVPVGLAAFAVIECVAVGYSLLSLWAA